jgi:hypothetical protein
MSNHACERTRALEADEEVQWTSPSINKTTIQPLLPETRTLWVDTICGIKIFLVLAPMAFLIGALLANPFSSTAVTPNVPLVGPPPSTESESDPQWTSMTTRESPEPQLFTQPRGLSPTRQSTITYSELTERPESSSSSLLDSQESPTSLATSGRRPFEMETSQSSERNSVTNSETFSGTYHNSQTNSE